MINIISAQYEGLVDDEAPNGSGETEGRNVPSAEQVPPKATSRLFNLAIKVIRGCP